MIIFRLAPFQLSACARGPQAFAVMAALSLAAGAAPLPHPPANVWYTQIGQWRIRHEDSTGGKSFLFHDSRIDGARSGRATANVRMNFAFRDIRRCEARLSLGPAPATAGLLVQDKQTTYYFLVHKGTVSDSLGIYRFRDDRMAPVSGVRATVPDTARLTLLVTPDSLCCRVDMTILWIAKPRDFPNPAYVGFECPLGSVKVFEAAVESLDTAVKESFANATLVNLHLDKMHVGGGK